ASFSEEGRPWRRPFSFARAAFRMAPFLAKCSYTTHFPARAVTRTRMRRSHLIQAGFAITLALGSLSISPAHAGLFGESKEEKAARIHEQNQDSSISDLTQRVHDLEEALRQATGQNESLAHQVQQLGDKIERQKKDFDYRLCAITAQQMGGADSDQQGGLSCGGGSGASSAYNMAPAPAQQSSDTVHL